MSLGDESSYGSSFTGSLPHSNVETVGIDSKDTDSVGTTLKSGHVSVSEPGDESLDISDKDQIKHGLDKEFVAKNPAITTESALGNSLDSGDKEGSKISAYARLDFDSYTFFVQTLQVLLGRKSNDEILNGAQHSVDVHLSSRKAISRRHAKIFYNFGTQRFELSIMGRNGAFVDDLFVEKGMTIPLVDGTKIQIGDIPFCFILPSLEPSQLKDASSADKPFNPSDAISLRSSLYSTSNSGSPNKRKKSIRRNSRVIPRKLSEARRKSLATATNEEINTILSELGVASIEDIDEQDPSYVDAQIKAILGDSHNTNESAIADDDDEDEDVEAGTLAEFNEGEEDELDKLVKQHNLEQGVELDEKILARDDHQITMDIHAIDEELSSLGPIINSSINSSNHELTKEKEERKRQLEQEKKSKQDLQRAGNNILNNAQGMNQNPNQNGQRILMGKPAVPRMGKPASIQPPASRLYGRNVPSNSGSFTGLPTHLVAQGDYSLKVAPGNIPNSYTMPRPPGPELMVPIQTIKQTPLEVPDVTVDKITVLTEYKPSPAHLTKVVGNIPMVPKVPSKTEPMMKRPSKGATPMNEIPEQYRIKPNLTVPVMIINVLKLRNYSHGLTMNEINDGIKEVYPFYQYCPDGWQSLVTHNVRLNKLFRASNVNGDNKENKEERWIIDEGFIEEKEKARKKQQDIASQRAKEAALRADEMKQKQRLEMQSSLSHNMAGHNIAGPQFMSPYGSPKPQSPSQMYSKQTSPTGSHGNPININNMPINTSGQRPKTIAELASEIRRDGGSKTPMYFKPNPNGIDSNSPSNIKAQLAANRSQYSHSPELSNNELSTSPKLETSPSASSRPQSPSMNQDTKKSLSYLQKELFNLYKARQLSYNTTTTTEIITKALATTIAQVNVIGSKAGVKDNALGFLVERAPQQVSKILDIALTKSIKEKQGILTSRSNSRGTTPGASQISSPKPLDSGLKESTPISNIVKEANRKFGVESPKLTKPPQYLSKKRENEEASEEQQGPNKATKS